MYQNIQEKVQCILSICAEQTGADPALVTARVTKRPYPYTRKLAIYHMRNYITKANCRYIASLMGFRSDHSIISRYFKEIYENSRCIDQVHQDVKTTELKIKMIMA